MVFLEVISTEVLLWPTVFLMVILIVLAALSLRNQIFKKIFKPIFALNMYFFTMLYNRMLSGKKKELFESMQRHLENVEGDVLEIGAGTGANFAFYPRGCSVMALDPNPHMNFYLCRTEKYYPHVTLKDYIVGTAENMKKIEDQSVSAVVSTLVLCSVDSVEQSLKEIIRVLKPGGRFYFMEHVKGKGFTLALQQWNQPWWYYVADGCYLLRDIEDTIRKAGFKSVECQSFEAQNVGAFIKPHIMGYADV